MSSTPETKIITELGHSTSSWSEDEHIGINSFIKTEDGEVLSPILKEGILSICEKPEELDRGNVIETPELPKRRIIPVDYEQFCSDIPENMLNYFPNCPRNKCSTPTENIEENKTSPPMHYLTVPPLSYGLKNINQWSCENATSSDSDFSDAEDRVKSKRKVKEAEANYSNGSGINGHGNNTSVFEIKEPTTLRRKKLILPPKEDLSESYCSVM